MTRTSWRKRSIGEIATKVGSGITPTGGRRVYRTHGRPFVRSQNVGWGELLLDELAYIDDETHATFPATELYDGDVLLNITGASIGRAALADRRLAGGNVNQHVCVIRVDNALADPLFIASLLLSRIGQSQIDSYQAGGNRQGLNFAQVRNIGFELPASVGEQQSIAAALADADGFVESLERLITKKRQIKLGAMQELLTGKRRLPGFEGEWQASTLGSLGRCIRGVSFDPDTHLHSTASSATVSLLRAQNVQNGDLNLNDVLHVSDCRVSDLQRLQFGDVVVCMANGSKALVGKAAVYEGSAETPLTVGAFMAIFRPDPNAGSTRLVPYLLHSHAFRAHIDILLAGSSINNLTPNSVESCTVAIPVDRNEQHVIAAVLSDMDAEIAALESRLTKARQIKQGMMQQLLTGKIRLPVKEVQSAEATPC